MTTTQTTENMVTRKPVKLPAAMSNAMEVSRGFKEPDPDRMRIVITGRPGCGKTSFVASNPKCLLYDLERGSDTVIDPACTRLQIKAKSTTGADDLRRSISALVADYPNDSDLREFITTVAFDSFDALVKMFSRDLCVKHNLEDPGEFGGGHGKGYFKIGDEIFGMFDQLGRVGLGVILIAHQSLKEVNGVTVPALNVSASFRNRVIEWRTLMFKMEATPGMVTQSLKGGMKVKIPSKDPKDRQYVLITDTTTTAEDFDSPKSNVPIESGLVIPAVNGWATYRAAYERAVAIRREEGTKNAVKLPPGA